MDTSAQQQAARRVDADDFAVFVRQLYRMFKISGLHLMNNEAVTRTIEQSVRLFDEIRSHGFDELSVLFLNDTVFVNGTLLKANRDVYEAAQDLSRLLSRIGFNQITIGADAGFDDIKGMVAEASGRLRGGSTDAPAEISAFPENATLIRISTELLEDLQSATLTATDRVGRTYASAIVVMRVIFDNLKRGNYVASRQLKRIAQQLVMLAETDSSAFLGVTRMRNVHDDEAGRAVNSAVLAIVTARQLTDDIKTLSRIALSTLLFDVGRPRAAGMGRDPSSKLGVIPRLDPAQRARLPVATAVSLAAIGRLQEEGLLRTVVGFEAQWLTNSEELGDPYRGTFSPRLESTLVSVVRRFDEALTFDVHSQSRLTPDQAIQVLRGAARDELERFCVDLLLQALGLLPRGTVVQMKSGWRGVIIANSDKPGLYGLPTIQLFADPEGKRAEGAVLDLAHPDETVARHGGITEALVGDVAPTDLPQVELTPPAARPAPPPQKPPAQAAPPQPVSAAPPPQQQPPQAAPPQPVSAAPPRPAATPKAPAATTQAPAARYRSPTGAPPPPPPRRSRSQPLPAVGAAPRATAPTPDRPAAQAPREPTPQQ